MAKENSFAVQEKGSAQSDLVMNLEATPTTKKRFIEPELSTPIDVLEATTFFQTTTSGVTN